MPRRFLLALVALPLIAAFGCSSDPYAPKASFPVISDTLRILALNGTAPEAESGVRLISAASEVPDFAEQFDFALDIDASGNVVLIPRSRVVTCTTTCQLGVRIVRADSIKFDAIYDAPKAGYKYDSLTTLPVGATALFVTKEIYCQPSNISTYDIYAKMVIDSVNLAERAIFARVVADPNCGFRGLIPGTTPAH